MKIIPIPVSLSTYRYILLEKQLKERIIKSCAIPKHLLKSKKLSTAEEMFFSGHVNKKAFAKAARTILKKDWKKL